MKMAMIITMVRDIDEQMYRNEQHTCVQYDAVITRTKRQCVYIGDETFFVQYNTMKLCTQTLSTPVSKVHVMP